MVGVPSQLWGTSVVAASDQLNTHHVYIIEMDSDSYHLQCSRSQPYNGPCCCSRKRGPSFAIF